MPKPSHSKPDTLTHVIKGAGNPSAPGYERDFAKFCNTYRELLYYFVRKCGYNEADAKDHTQDFLARISQPEHNPLSQHNKERGRFRNFIKWQMRSFLSAAKEKASAKKRGGDIKSISFDLQDAEQRFQVADRKNLDPSEFFDRILALEIFRKVEAELAFQYQQRGETALHADLKPHLYGDTPEEIYADLAARLSMTKRQIQAAIEKMRGSFRTTLRQHVSRLCANPADVESELEALKRAL